MFERIRKNRRILRNDVEEGCNCKTNSVPCPLDGNCLVRSVVYKATVTTNQPNLRVKTYHGMTQESFKQRWYGHNHDFKHKDKYGTTLSHHVWKIKDLEASSQKNFEWNIQWKIKEKAPAYKPGEADCKLCLAEKFHILNERDKISLNLRSELLSKCRHKAKWKLSKLLT